MRAGVHALLAAGLGLSLAVAGCSRGKTSPAIADDKGPQTTSSSRPRVAPAAASEASAPADSSPPPTAPGLRVVSVSCGDRRTCAALDDGSVWCWGGAAGLNKIGAARLGTGRVPVRMDVAEATQVAVGDAHACVLKRDGTVWCVGRNAEGQLGTGKPGDESPLAQAVGLTGAKSIAAAGDTTCALLGTGAVKCWGKNEDGQIGDGGTTNRRVPATVAGLAGASAVAMSERHACALLKTGNVRCWGNNTAGEADGSSRDHFEDGLKLRPIPIDVSGAKNAAEVAVGAFTTYVRFNDGRVDCFGACRAWRSAPAELPRSGTRVIAAGGGGGCVVGGDGSLWCALFVLGEGQREFSRVSVSGTVGALALGTSHACVVADSLACWGVNNSGELGTGAGRGVVETPGLVAWPGISMAGFPDPEADALKRFVQDGSCSPKPEGDKVCSMKNFNDLVGNDRPRPHAYLFKSSFDENNAKAAKAGCVRGVIPEVGDVDHTFCCP